MFEGEYYVNNFLRQHVTMSIFFSPYVHQCVIQCIQALKSIIEFKLDESLMACAMDIHEPTLS